MTSPPLSISQSKVLNPLRKATEITIKFDPRTIILTPRIRTRNPDTGFYEESDGTPRPAQTFAIEPIQSTLVGITSTTGGVTKTEGAQTHSWSYYLIGRYDAEMEINDFWKEGGTTYWIVGIHPKNDYEKRGVVVGYGLDPNYGS